MDSYPKLYQNVSDATFVPRAIQLWSNVPNQYESLIRTTDGTHNQSHAWNTGEGGTPPEHGSLSTKIDTTAASNLGLNPADGSAMETPASSCLVFGSKGIFPSPLLGIPCKQYPVCLMFTCLI